VVAKTSHSFASIPLHEEERYGQPAVNGEPHPSFSHPTNESFKRGIDEVSDDGEEISAKKTKNGEEKEGSRNVVRPERPKQWKALFVPVKNFDERGINEAFIVKESYVKDFGDVRKDREGLAITEIRKARDLLKIMVSGRPDLGLGDDPLLASLCDYGSRVAVKGLGYAGDPKSEEGNTIATAGAQGAGNAGKSAKLVGEQAVEARVPVDISTKLLNSSAYEDRTLVRQVMYSVGRPLTQAKNPQELLDAIKGILRGK
jgi:hypothetical protein